MLRLDGKTAVITGGAGNLSAATAALFAEQGARIVLVDSDEAALRGTVEEIGRDSVDCLVADVTREDEVERYTREARDRLGGLDVVILNAGIEGAIAAIPDYPIEIFDRVMAVNVRGVWLGLRSAIPRMRDAAGGSIIVASSISGVKAAARLSAYAASKHAVIGIMRSAAMECAGEGIRVNAVGFGPLETRMMRSIETGFNPAAPDDAHAFISDRIPLGRYGTVEEAAQLMLYLASDASSFCTGGVYMADGGMTAR